VVKISVQLSITPCIEVVLRGTSQSKYTKYGFIKISQFPTF
jgi:hypothetical protein